MMNYGYLVTRLTGLGTLFLMIYVLTTWMLPQRLGRAERTASPDELQKVVSQIVTYLFVIGLGCHDLAKQLSHYLYLLYFFFSFGLTTQEGVWESIT